MPSSSKLARLSLALGLLVLVSAATSLARDDSDIDISFGTCTPATYTLSFPGIISYNCGGDVCNILFDCADPTANLDYTGGTCTTGGPDLCASYTTEVDKYITKDCYCTNPLSALPVICASAGLSRGGSQTIPACDQY